MVREQVNKSPALIYQNTKAKGKRIKHLANIKPYYLTIEYSKRQKKTSLYIYIYTIFIVQILLDHLVASAPTFVG